MVVKEFVKRKIMHKCSYSASCLISVSLLKGANSKLMVIIFGFLQDCDVVHFFSKINLLFAITYHVNSKLFRKIVLVFLPI